jgi:hypothetical protein
VQHIGVEGGCHHFELLFGKNSQRKKLANFGDKNANQEYLTTKCFSKPRNEKEQS